MKILKWSSAGLGGRIRYFMGFAGPLGKGQKYQMGQYTGED
jgi:hypothetical protein